MLNSLFMFVFSVFILAISPGPDTIFVLTQSIVNGKKQAFGIIIGLMTGCLIHTTIVAVGVSEVILQNNYLFTTIKILGALYLLYLAYKIYKSDAIISITSKKKEEKTLYELFKTGILMNVLNPKVTIFFLAFFPQFLFSNKISMILQFYILGVLFIVVSSIVFLLIAVLADSIAYYIKRDNKKIGLFFKWIQIIVFIIIAVLILK